VRKRQGGTIRSGAVTCCEPLAPGGTPQPLAFTPPTPDPTPPRRPTPLTLHAGGGEFPHLIFLTTIYPLMFLAAIVLLMLYAPFGIAYYVLWGHSALHGGLTYGHAGPRQYGPQHSDHEGMRRQVSCCQS
jgi:hypothetical protein